MSKKRDKSKRPETRNFVAKHAKEFCQARTHRDRKNDYRRKDKHRPNYRDGGGVVSFLLRLVW